VPRLVDALFLLYSEGFDPDEFVLFPDGADGAATDVDRDLVASLADGAALRVVFRVE
jgi:hypothetical protein